ncbi:ribosome small subunit-dependent GTPase A [Maritalea sp.]|uniref:ribosome small subunit-dependent GTPase A n=1 Tax=Maritalea sp. TaxID=2003361 RepID=UPI003EF6C15A
MSQLDRLGWQSFFAQQISVDDWENTPPARVVEVHRSGLHVIGADFAGMIPPRQDATVGDWVLINHSHLQSSKVLDRKSVVKRRAAGAEYSVQLIAANIDTTFIVSSCNQDFNVARLERYIALALEAEIAPVIVLTKVDLVSNAEEFVENARAISKIVPVVTLNARTDEAIHMLAEWCKPGKTVAFLGSSGVGKSTLTNALAGTQSIETQETREGDAKGRHTTTTRQLHFVPSGCVVLDTPGMRELQLTDVAGGISELFADIESLTTQCRFNDCRHETEPGCAILKALETEEIDAARLARWRKLTAEEAFNSASLSDRRNKDKAFGKMVRKVTKQKANRRKKKD